ncbi:Aspartate-trna ligase [Mycena sanguinolenta]|uniref:aspartate--tRNA ligase n=1 Tax=Mycena sanguinolenta TaxID=230812 RepID=A0A8H6XL32_9AGAR|nr:Aspartate-trna ligase [Mycena sanguinolenta]
MVFLNLRQRSDSVQALVIATPGQVSKQMVKWVSGLADESIVLVQGLVRKSPELIKSTSMEDVEVHVSQIHLISGIDMRLPFSVEAGSRVDIDETSTNQAVFKLQSGIGDLFRQFLNNNGFLGIHTPKLQGAATESGASVFNVSYFKGNAFLAPSPQLAKQMAIAADFERVYEIGPVFHAEDANIHRYLTESMGVDLEMTIEEHYHEVVELLDCLFLSIFRGLKENYSHEISIVRKQFPAEEFKWREGPEGTLKLTFRQAIDIIVKDGMPKEILGDLNMENERRLGRLVKAKYDTDYFIVDKSPIEFRPFYTMPDPEDPTLSNSYDFFMRGEKVLSGAQRIHDPALLCEKMCSKGIDPESMKAYLDGFRMGSQEHRSDIDVPEGPQKIGSLSLYDDM